MRREVGSEYPRLLTGVVLAVALLALAPRAWAQDGTITGIVLDAGTGDPIIEAGVEVIGAGKTVRTDLDGKYTVAVPPGVYEVRIFAPLYQGTRLQSVGVEAGKVRTADAVLSPAGEAGIEVVEVVAEAHKAAEATQLVRRKKAAVVSDNVSAEVIAKSTDSDAAEIVQRAPAVTVKDDKYIVVRGLNERYTTALLNGSRLPSTDPERRAIPLDLFPGDFVESISIVKTYTPDLPGDFSGGLAQVELKEFPEKLSYGIGTSTSFNTETTFQKFDGYKGGGLDYFGFDQNVRSLPSLIPDDNVRDRPAAQLQAFGRSFKNIWDVESTTAPPNYGIDFSVGNTIGDFGFNLAGLYETEHKFRRQIERQYLNAGTPDDPEISLEDDFVFDISEFEVHLGGVFTSAYRLAPGHRLTFRSLYDRRVTDEVKDGEGFNEQTGAPQSTTVFEYEQQTLAFGQLAGDHHFSVVDVEWRTAFARTTQEKPDSRFQVRNNGLFSNESGGGTRAFSDLTEYLSDSGVDVTIPFRTQLPGTDVWKGLAAKVKVGAAYAYRDRDSELRRFRFRRVGAFDVSLPTEDLLVPENIGPQGFQLVEETQPQDAFGATHEIAGAYGMVDLPLWRDRLRFVGGVRTEYSYITLDTFDQLSVAPRTVIKNDLDPLPGVNLIYTPMPDMNVRFGYSQSVARPEFRELSPAVFPAARGFRPTIGNPDLEQSEIESIDLRWEWFFSPTELVSLSGFYKKIDRPIEQIVLVQGGNLSDSFANAETATLMGFEFEGRKDFGFIAPPLRALTLHTNVTYVESDVDVPGGELQVQTSTNRPLQGQAPFVVNAALEYAHDRWGTFRLIYNTVDRRIESVGAFGLADIFHERRDQLDFVYLVGVDVLGIPLKLKVAVENILDDDYLFTQEDQVQRQYDLGAKFALGVSYTY